MPETSVADEAKAIVALAFRNGPIESCHAGDGISDEDMRAIMKHAVDWVYLLLKLRDSGEPFFDAVVQLGMLFTTAWDDPDPKAADGALRTLAMFTRSQKPDA